MTDEHPPMPRKLERVPASARLVWARLDQHGPLTRRELMRWTLLPESTLHDALDLLDEGGWVESEYCPREGYQVQYVARRVLRDSESSEE